MDARMLFVYPTGCLDREQGPTSFPIQLASLVSYLQNRYPGDQFPVIDVAMCCGLPVSPAGEEEVLARFLAEAGRVLSAETIVGISAVTVADIVHSLPLVRALKETYGSTVVLGGYMPHICADFVVTRFHDFFDAVIRGAGELACAAMLDQMAGRGQVDWALVPGATYWTEEGVRALPPAARPSEHLPINYSCLPAAGEYGFLLYMTSRGCARRCHFCPERTVNPVVNHIPVDMIARDLEEGASTLPREARRVLICDADFASSKRHFTAVMSLLERLDLKTLYMTRPDNLKSADIGRTAGSTSAIYFGLEAPTDRMLRVMHKTRNPSAYRADAGRVARACSESGVIPVFGLLPGYPGIRKEELETFYRFVDSLYELCNSCGTGVGFSIASHRFFMIPWGLKQWHEAADYQAQGTELASAFPAEYHGVEIPADWQYNVVRPSREVSREDVDKFLHTAGQLSAETLAANSLEELNRFGSAASMSDLSPYLPDAAFVSDSRQVLSIPEARKCLLSALRSVL